VQEKFDFLPELKRYIYKFTSKHSHTCAHIHAVCTIYEFQPQVFFFSVVCIIRLSCEQVKH